MSGEIYLASKSPRRAELLRQMGLKPLLIDLDLAEYFEQNEAADAIVCSLARKKANAGWQSPQRVKMLPVVAADTLVVCNGKLLGKPENPAEAIQMLQSLNHREHLVFTGVAIIRDEQIKVEFSCTRVQFDLLSSAQIEAYVASGEFIGKAGAYAIQGKAAQFVRAINGEYSNVVGLPLNLTWRMLANF